MFRYEPPARWNDFEGHPLEQQALRSWSDFILANFQLNIEALQSQVPSPLFFSEADQPILQETRSIPVPWNGFPKVLALQHGGPGDAAWQAADDLRARFNDGAGSPRLVLLLSPT
jgi:hypothetical protein